MSYIRIVIICVYLLKMFSFLPDIVSVLANDVHASAYTAFPVRNFHHFSLGYWH